MYNSIFKNVQWLKNNSYVLCIDRIYKSKMYDNGSTKNGEGGFGNVLL